jgi:5-methylcytosine-specific restriction endonuclease McrA
MRREFSQVVRDEALLRCAYRCESCGSKSDLELHHRGHRADTSLFNCVVLCAGCHAQEHQRRRLRPGRG